MNQPSAQSVENALLAFRPGDRGGIAAASVVQASTAAAARKHWKSQNLSV